MRNEDDPRAREEDEIADNAFFDAVAMQENRKKAKRWIREEIIPGLETQIKAIENILEHIRNPDICKDEYRIYVFGNGETALQQFKRTLGYIERIKDYFEIKKMCADLGINQVNGTFINKG